MADFISRDEFAEHLADIQFGEAPTGRTGENIDYQKGVYAGFDMAYVALKRFPAADVRPAKKAMCEVEGYGWTEHVMEYTDWRCHACGGFWTVCAELGEAFDKYSFCPRCGAELT